MVLLESMAVMLGVDEAQLRTRWLGGIWEEQCPHNPERPRQSTEAARDPRNEKTASLRG